MTETTAWNDVAAIEAAGYDTWTSDETAEVAGWTLHSNGGFTRRVNCATGSGSPATDPDAREDVDEWLSERGGRPVVRVTPLLSSETIDAVAHRWGYLPVDETVVMTSEVGQRGSSGGIQVVDCDDRSFVDDFVELNQRPDSSLGAWSRMMSRVSGRAAGLWVPTQAVGVVVASGDLAVVYSVAVAPTFRRRGLATAIMDEADVWAAERGCKTLFLQVVGNNVGALALYEALGFEEAYRYHYLEPKNVS